MSLVNGYPVNTDKLKEVVDTLSKGRNVTTLWLPKMARTEFASKLQDKELMLELLGDKYKEILTNTTFIFLSLNLSEKYFFIQLEDELINYSSKKGIRAKIRDISKNGKIVFIIDNFSFRNTELLQYLITLCQIDIKNINFLFVALESDFHKDITNLEDFGIFYENIIHFNYLDLAEFMEWYEMNKKKYDKYLTIKEQKQLYTFTGGMIGMIKVIMENFKIRTSLEQTVETTAVKDYIGSVWDRFTGREKKIIKNIIKGTKVPPYPREIAYLKAHGLISKQNTITTGWFNYLIDQPVKLNLTLIQTSIAWADLNISELLKPRDNKILLVLFNANGETLSRDNLAEVIWGENWHVDYSNWALDQSISRLRRKLKEIGMPDIIKSAKGKGFYLEA